MRDIASRAASPVKRLADAHLMPLLYEWWRNPLLHHARRSHKLPPVFPTRIVPLIAVVFFLLSIAAWVTGWRPLGAALTVISLGGVLLPVFVAPVASADRVSRQMRFSKRDPRRLIDDMPVPDITWGLVLVTLWRLRWLILVALALTPALLLSVMRLDMIDYLAWQDTITPQAAEALAPGGGIPVMRLAMRGISAAVMPYIVLLAYATMGVTAAVALRDSSLSALAALLVQAVTAPILFLVWHIFSRTTLLTGWLEIARLVLLAGLIGGLVVLTWWLNRLNADYLTDPPEITLTQRDDEPTVPDIETSG